MVGSGALFIMISLPRKSFCGNWEREILRLRHGEWSSPKASPWSLSPMMLLRSARVYQVQLQLPPKAGNDILHIAFAVAYEVDYLLTWNCAHIANGHTIKRLAKINEELDWPAPVIVTPEELLE